METGYDIIFFWVARMMMLGIYVAEKVPFRTVYLHGLVKDPSGKRMAKTKGNVVDPLHAIDESGADALRFALVLGTSPGNDQKFRTEKLDDGRNFANKLWNATRFVLGARPASIPAGAPRRAPDPAALGPAERWIRSRTAAAVVALDGGLAELQLAEVTRTLYEAIWSEYCDWGLELAKGRLPHPVMPFVTEELWAAIPHAAAAPELLIVADWPAAGPRDAVAEAEVDAIVELVRAVRNARAEAGIVAASWLPIDVAVPAGLASAFDALSPAIARLARARPLTSHAARADLEVAAPAGLAVIAGALEARISTPETGSSDGDRARLEKELGEAEGFLAAARARLANDAFTSKAPPAVVEGARAREAELAETVERVRARPRR